MHKKQQQQDIKIVSNIYFSYTHKQARKRDLLPFHCRTPLPEDNKICERRRVENYAQAYKSKFFILSSKSPRAAADAVSGCCLSITIKLLPYNKFQIAN